MNKKLILIVLVLIAIVAVVCFVRNDKAGDPLNISYTIRTETFELVDGKAQGVMIFGEPVYGDLDADGDEDAALLLVHEPGGSGTFYYAALAIRDGDLFKATESMFLGDRIAPQTIEIREGRAVYNYAVRRADEPFSTPPSIGKSTWVHYNTKTNEIGEWVKDFEGESALPR